MILRLVALAISIILTFQIQAQIQKVTEGPEYPTGSYYYMTSLATTNSKSQLMQVYLTGSGNSRELNFVTFDDDMIPDNKSIDVAQINDRRMLFDETYLFNNKILHCGFCRAKKTNWPYYINAISQDGNIDPSKEINLTNSFRLGTFSSSGIYCSGFAQSPNSKYGAVYVAYTYKFESYLSIAVFDSSMNQVSNTMIKIPGYVGHTDVGKLMVDDDGNAIGVMRDVSAYDYYKSQYRPKSIVENLNYDKTLYTAILKKGGEIKLTKLPVDGIMFEAIDMEAAENDDYRIFGIYQAPNAKKGKINGGIEFLVNMEGEVKKGLELNELEDFNYTHNFADAISNTQVLYRVLPAVKTDDNATVYTFQREHIQWRNASTSSNSRSYAGSAGGAPVMMRTVEPFGPNSATGIVSVYYLDMFFIKINDKGIEWTAHMPSLSHSGSYTFVKNGDNINIVFQAAPGLKFTPDYKPTAKDSGTSGKGAYYVATLTGDGEITVDDGTNKEYNEATDGFVIDKTVYKRAKAFVGLKIKDNMTKIDLEK